MNILVTGCKGQLGNEMQIAAKNIKSNDYYFFTDYEELDILNKDDVNFFVKNKSIDVIVNCAAWTNVDKAETCYDKARELNVDGVVNLANAIKSNGGWLVHISTDYVYGYDLRNIPYTEDITPNPSGAYGETKYYGEKALCGILDNYVIIRTAWLYSEFGKNFLKTMMDLTSSKESLKVVFDQVGSPTYAYDLACAIVDIIDNRKLEGNAGLYHYTNEGVCSWYDFTQEIAHACGNLSCKIYPCHSDEFPSPVKRPSYSVLDKSKFKKTFNQEIPYWRHSMLKCIDNLLGEPLKILIK